jgi:sugar phosphate isomerase/epimerase
MKISFITAVVTQSFDEAVRFARQNGLAGLELRSVEDTAVDMLPAETLRTWRRRLDAEGLTVCGLAGSFYKCAPEPDAVEAELAKLERLCDAADIWAARSSAALHSFARREGPLPAETLEPYFERPVRAGAARGPKRVLEGTQVIASKHAALARMRSHRLARVRAILTGQLCTTWAKAYPDRLRGHPSFACYIKEGARVPEKILRKGGQGAGGLYR